MKEVEEKQKSGIPVVSVVQRSPAARSGIRAGDILLKIDGRPVADVLDYMFYAAEQKVTLDLQRQDQLLQITVRKGEYDDLGLEFTTFLMDEKQSCRNRCVFCFIDQLPPGMRDTLYFKDDDARLSFLQGNYITLTNLTDKDVDRIIDMRLNINVSVHTTDPELRCRMMGNRFAGKALDHLFRMGRAGIQMNCQIVLCPGLNDGEALKKTIHDLANFMPSIQSVAVVPVGVTKFRKGLYPLRPFTMEEAGAVVDEIERSQEKFLAAYETRLVFASDEFYLLAGRELPPGSAYEDYPQYENGVGMLRCLLDDFSQAVEDMEKDALPSSRHIAIATGVSAYPAIKQCADMAQKKWPLLQCDVIPVKNDFFGHTITVAGLLTGQDIVRQLAGKDLGETLLLSQAMFMAGSDIFLDDMTAEEVSRSLGVPVQKVGREGYELLDAMLGK